jgi:hypothetical protein
VTASLAYRKNESAIKRGAIPEKYTRLLPYIPGDRVLEVGSAEGVLALCLGRADLGAKKEVTALERKAERHESAIALRSQWARAYRFTALPVFHCGDVSDHLDLLDGVDTLVAVRMIYYLGDQLDSVFEQVARLIPNVVLCGNSNRANWYRSGVDMTDTKANNYYASREGMTELLKRHGYRIVQEGSVNKGDEVVVGRKDG